MKKICSFLLRLVLYVTFIIFIATFIVLAFADIRFLIHKIPHYYVLKSNLDFLALIVSNYGALIIAFLLIGLIFYLAFKFHVNVAEFSLLGMTFTLRDQEDIVKSQIRNYLNTKRSLFYFLEDYDNIYNVMKSWYEILNFIRLQFSKVENGGDLSKQCDEKLQGFVLELNDFLTKFHSDYRRWFEWKLKMEESKDAFTPFIEIQKDYSHYPEIRDAIHGINIKMREYGDYFGVNYSKWNKVN